MNSKKYFIGVDGGGTGTDFYLSDENLSFLDSYSSTPSNYLVQGIDNVCNILREGVHILLNRQNLTIDKVEKAYFGLAGVGDIPGDFEKIELRISSLFPGLNFQIGNDTENALAGSLSGKDGINIISGTGSIGLGRFKNNCVKAGGWHHIFGGDEGSAYWFACQMLLHFSWQSDGREEKTYLYHYLREKYKWNDDSDMLVLILDIYKENRSKIASMCLDFYECALNRDPVCLDILDQGAIHLSKIVKAIYDKLNVDEELLLSYSGGVFKMGDLIISPLKNHINNLSLKLIPPVFSPGIGSLILALGDKFDREKMEKLLKC